MDTRILINSQHILNNGSGRILVIGGADLPRNVLVDEDGWCFITDNGFLLEYADDGENN